MRDLATPALCDTRLEILRKWTEQSEGEGKTGNKQSRRRTDVGAGLWRRRTKKKARDCWL